MKDPQIIHHLSQTDNIVNLLVMSYMWSATAFCYYLIGFYMKYMPGDIYFNMIIGALAEIVGTIVAGLLMRRY